MKIRKGFVSNSSSSSFVILGFDDKIEIPEEELKRRGVLWKDENYKDFRLIGVLIDTGDEGWSEFDSSDFDKKYSEAKKEMTGLIKEFSLGVKEHFSPKLKLYFLNKNYHEFGRV